MSQRIDYAQQSNDMFKKYLQFSMATSGGSIDETLRHLVTLRASQLNGCAFCVDMHVKEAKIAGERELRLHHVTVWRESPLFNDRERAALEWTEALTVLNGHGVADEVYDKVRIHLSDKELADLSFLIVGINGWNRLSVGFAKVPGSADSAYGLDKAGLH
jgi:AhpD family alkylhydroperoxidase